TCARLLTRGGGAAGDRTEPGEAVAEVGMGPGEEPGRQRAPGMGDEREPGPSGAREDDGRGGRELPGGVGSAAERRVRVRRFVHLGVAVGRSEAVEIQAPD